MNPPLKQGACPSSRDRLGDDRLHDLRSELVLGEFLADTDCSRNPLFAKFAPLKEVVTIRRTDKQQVERVEFVGRHYGAIPVLALLCVPQINLPDCFASCLRGGMQCLCKLALHALYGLTVRRNDEVYVATIVSYRGKNVVAVFAEIAYGIRESYRAFVSSIHGHIIPALKQTSHEKDGFPMAIFGVRAFLPSLKERASSPCFL